MSFFHDVVLNNNLPIVPNTFHTPVDGTKAPYLFKTPLPAPLCCQMNKDRASIFDDLHRLCNEHYGYKHITKMEEKQANKKCKPNNPNQSRTEKVHR